MKGEDSTFSEWLRRKDAAFSDRHLQVDLCDYIQMLIVVVTQFTKSAILN